MLLRKMGESMTDYDNDVKLRKSNREYYRRQWFKMSAGTIGIVLWAFMSAFAAKIVFRDVSWHELGSLAVLAGATFFLTFSIIMAVSGGAYAVDRYRYTRQQRRQQDLWERARRERDIDED